MQVDNATNLDRKSGVRGTDNDLVPMLSQEGSAGPFSERICHSYKNLSIGN
jgi:hypothetical protein